MFIVSCSPQNANKKNIQTLSGSQFPKIIHNEVPIYPDYARKNGIKGVVVVVVTVDQGGNVVDATIHESDHEKLDDVSIAAAKKCKFEPWTSENYTKIKMNIPFTFDIN